MDKLVWEEQIPKFELLVCKLARAKVKQYRLDESHFDDLHQEGMLGLKTGLERYDPQRGAKLSSIVAMWALNYMRLYISRNARIVSSKSGAYRSNFWKGKIPKNISLDIPINDDNETTLRDLLHGKYIDPETAIIKNGITNKIRDELLIFRANLNERDRLVFDKRLYCRSEDREICETLAKICGITQQAINEREKKLIKKLRIQLAHLRDLADLKTDEIISDETVTRKRRRGNGYSSHSPQLVPNTSTNKYSRVPD